MALRIKIMKKIIFCYLIMVNLGMFIREEDEHW